MSDGQFGNRMGHSGINATAIMVKRPHASRTNGDITGVLLMDRNPAFPRFGKGRLVDEIKAKHIDRDLIQWTQSFVAPWMVEILIEGNDMTTHPVDEGVPQDSSLSLILYAIYMSGLIKWVEGYVLAKGPSVVEDFVWVASGRNVNQVVTKLEK